MTNEFLKVIELNNEEYAMFDGDCLRLYKIPREKLSEFQDYISTSKPRYFAEVGSLNRLSRLTLCISGICNLACKYCYEGDQNSRNTNKFMSRDTVRKAIDFVYEEYKEGINCVQFFGGEPLLAIDTMVYVIEYISNICNKLSINPPSYTIVTNGTLIDDKVHELFNRYFSRITISLDGRKEVNDSNRIFANHLGSVYERVHKNLEKYRDERLYSVDIQMTITEEQLSGEINDISDYLHIKGLGVDSIHITPLINTKNYRIEEQKLYTARIMRYFQKCYEVELQNINETNYYKLLSLVHILKSKTPSDYYCGAGFLDISIDVGGNIFPCFMFNGNSAFVMGSVYGDVKTFSDKRDMYINNRISKNEECANCWAHGICSSGHSGCIGAFYLENGRIDTPISRNCMLTQSVFETVLCKIAEFSKI